jgi:hypothetical protein
MHLSDRASRVRQRVVDCRRCRHGLVRPEPLAPGVPKDSAMDLKLAGKNTLITGASKGIGGAAAEMLSQCSELTVPTTAPR